MDECCDKRSGRLPFQVWIDFWIFLDFGGGKRLPKFKSYFSLLGLWGGAPRDSQTAAFEDAHPDRFPTESTRLNRR